VCGALAVAATTPPFDFTFAEEPGPEALLSGDRPELRVRVTVCGVKPYTGGGLRGNDPLLDEPERSEIHVFIDHSDAPVRARLTRLRVDDDKLLKPIDKSRKVFDRDLRLKLISDGLYCDSQTELTLAAGDAGTSATVHWHVEVDYFGDLDAPWDTPPTITIEPLP
jgi:hypothetical protein